MESGRSFRCTLTVPAVQDNPWSEGGDGYVTVEIRNNDDDVFWRSLPGLPYLDGLSGEASWQRIRQ